MSALVAGELFLGRDLKTNEFDQLRSWQWAILRQVGRSSLWTATGQRLLLVLRTIECARFAALFVASRSGLIKSLHRPRFPAELGELDPVMCRSFLDLLTKLGLATEQDGRVGLKKPYRRSLQLDFVALIDAVQEQRWEKVAAIRVVPGTDAGLWKSFVFVYLLNSIVRGHDIDVSMTAWCGLDRRWKSIAQSGVLDYEIVVSGLVFEMLPATLVEKTSCKDSGELFFAELGRRAYRAFTQRRFESTITSLAQSRPLKTAIDIGCGLGDYIESLRSTGGFSNITGIERQPSAVAHLRERYSNAPDVNILAEDVLSSSDVPQADLVLLIFVLLYFSPEQKRALFRKIACVLSEEGVVLIGQYFPHVERMRKELAQHLGDYGLIRKMDILLSSKLQYTEVMVNDSSSAFQQAVRWDELNAIIEEAGLNVLSITNADPYYYAFFIVVGRNKRMEAASK